MKRLIPLLAISFLVGEIKTNMTKQCIYNYLGNKYTITVSSVEFCPMQIEI
jgi:hypothetical protein